MEIHLTILVWKIPWTEKLDSLESMGSQRVRQDLARQVLGPGALGRPRGIGWRGRWEGGSGWGTHVNPCLIHVNVWQKPLQYCKVISLQLIKVNGKKKVKVVMHNSVEWNLCVLINNASPLWPKAHAPNQPYCSISILSNPPSPWKPSLHHLKVRLTPSSLSFEWK